MYETWVGFLAQEDPLEEDMAADSSILDWRIPWTEEPGGLQSTGSQRVGHDWRVCFEWLLLTEIYLHNLIFLSSVASVMSISLHPHRLYIAHQAPVSMGFSRQEYWRELPCPLPEVLPYPRILLRKSHYIHFTDKGIDGIVKLLKFPKAVTSKYGSGLYPQSCLSSRSLVSFLTPGHISEGKPQMVLDFTLPVISYRSISYFACAWLSPSNHPSQIPF